MPLIWGRLPVDWLPVGCPTFKWLAAIWQERRITRITVPIIQQWSPNDISSGPCLTTATWRCRKNFSQWERSFLWKLRCHWLKGLRQRQIAVVRQGPAVQLRVATKTICDWRDRHRYSILRTVRLGGRVDKRLCQLHHLLLTICY